MRDINNHRGYLKVIKWLFLLTPMLVAFNYIVDPYGIHSSVSIDGLNVVKPAIINHRRLFKAYKVLNYNPQSLILGASRSERGISPEHRGWKHLPVYNLSLDGVNMYEVYRYFQHVVSNTKIKQVLLGLDFSQFSLSNVNKPDFNEERLILENRGLNFILGVEVNDFISTTATNTAFFESVKTVGQQHQMPYLLNNGMQNSNYHETRYIESGLSQNDWFKLNERDYIMAVYRDYVVDSECKETTPFDWVKKIIKLAHKNKIDLRIFISPVHARQMEAIYTSGLWESFEQWKEKLVELNVNEAKYEGGAAYIIWDFSGYNEYTTELVPTTRYSENKMKWYWESSHYKKELGDIMLSTIFEEKIYNDFGVKLTAGNINSHLKATRNARNLWLDLNVDSITSMRDIKTEANKRYRKKKKYSCVR